MESGIYIGVKDERGVKAVYIPKEVQEFANLNKRVQARLDDAAEQEQKKADREYKNTRRMAKQEREMVRLARQSAALLGITAACGLAGYLDLMSYWLAWPVMAVCLVAAGVKMGKWKTIK